MPKKFREINSCCNFTEFCTFWGNIDSPYALQHHQQQPVHYFRLNFFVKLQWDKKVPTLLEAQIQLFFGVSELKGEKQNIFNWGNTRSGTSCFLNSDFMKFVLQQQ